MGKHQFTYPYDNYAVDRYQEEGTDSQLSSLFQLSIRISELRAVVWVVALLDGEMLDVDVDGQEVEDLGKEKDFEEVGEEESDGSGHQLACV